MLLKSGRFGPYVSWRGFNVALKPGQDADADADMDIETVTPLLLAKAHPAADAVDHCVGPFRIKRGIHGLFMYQTGGAPGKKPDFINIPEDTAWARLTVEGAEALYASAKSAKSAKTKKRAEGASKAPAKTKAMGKPKKPSTSKAVTQVDDGSDVGME